MALEKEESRPCLTSPFLSLSLWPMLIVLWSCVSNEYMVQENLSSGCQILKKNNFWSFPKQFLGLSLLLSQGICSSVILLSWQKKWFYVWGCHLPQWAIFRSRDCGRRLIFQDLKASSLTTLEYIVKIFVKLFVGKKDALMQCLLLGSNYIVLEINIYFKFRLSRWQTEHNIFITFIFKSYLSDSEK